MATLRQWLDKEGFDWDTGVIVAHTLKEDSYSPGWGSGNGAFKFDFRDKTQLDGKHNELLDHVFDCGYGAPEAPRFVAEDKNRFYFPVQYDGSTWIESIHKNIDHYMDINNDTPYPGG